MYSELIEAVLDSEKIPACEKSAILETLEEEDECSNSLAEIVKDML